MRQFGQAKLPASYISRSSYVIQDRQVKVSKKPVTLSEFLNRKLGKTRGKLLQISIGSLGSDRKEVDGKRNEDGSRLMADDAFFRQFNRALKEKDSFGSDENEQKGSRKRKTPVEFSSGDTDGHQKHLVVLGDDPKPRPRIQQKLMDQSGKTIYNHYASGWGWWDGDKEGIDSEEVGYNEVWEGVGSTTLGGLEWH
ncbi:uncharacterized protein LOC110039440 isoform X2 [Phalaenopsis equestris]|uniref:uncharacterized protein LOC110039440 isoform X2 n=1 Tax=Phalaenopsis equestris TaxID=78828 RepID=UPI0009E1DDFE|nr:uncharacterized protein LOC110039440 isoform X2 [Phalaenopsis equestris]